MSEPILRVEDVRKYFPTGGSFLARLLSGSGRHVRAVDGVSFALEHGEVFGLVGESGCGKTTLGRTILRLTEPTSGRILFEGQDITQLPEKELRPLRRRMQIVFQDPHAALNPAMTIGQAIAHPLWIHGLVKDEEEGRRQVLQTLREVGLEPAEELFDRYPADLSGGQKQRTVIARAIILRPSFVVADEAVAMLDMSVRAKILELLLDLKAKYGLTYLFITHDLATAKFLCQRIAIMYLGKIVEMGRAEDIYQDPWHPYTKALLGAIPIPDPSRRREKVIPRGEVPDAIAPPAGCRFHPRCPEAFSACGWEPRDLLDLLELKAAESSAHLHGALGSAWIRENVLVVPVGRQDAEAVVKDMQSLIESAGPMGEALENIEVTDREVHVSFMEPLEPRDLEVRERLVKCHLFDEEVMGSSRGALPQHRGNLDRGRGRPG